MAIGSSQASKRRDVPAPSSAMALLLTGSGSFLATLDLFIVNVAFPDIRVSFPGTSTQQLSWVLTAYGIVFAALLVPAGRLGDVYGRRRVFRLGMGIFAVGSAGCAAAPGVGVLIACRALQGGGSALMVSTSLGLLLACFPESRHRRVVAIWAATGSVAASCGPPIGGLLVQAGWRWIFLVNLPVAAVTLVLARRLPEQRHPDHGGLPDLAGAALLVLGLVAVVAALSNASAWGPGSRELWGCCAVGAVTLGAFLRRCATHARPVIDLALFRRAQFSAATLGMAAFYAAFGIMLLGGTLFLTQVWHYGSIRAGLAFAPGPSAATVFAIVGSRLPVARRWLVLTGSMLFAAAALWWAVRLGPGHDYLAAYLPALIACGTGVGLTQASLLAAGASVLPASHYATGTGIINTARQVGSAIGVAALVSVLGAGLTVGDYRTGWWLMAAAGALAALVAPLLKASAVSAGLSAEPAGR